MATFEIVESPEQLERAVAFLSNGFNWSARQASLIRRSVLACNGDRAHGGWLVDADGRIVSAILFFYQGEIRSNELVRSVIGTSSWCAEEAHRGLASIMFLKRVIDYLKLHYDVITIYTPTDIATEVHRRLGFEHQDVSRIKLFAWNAWFPAGIRKLRISAKEDQVEYIEGFSYLGQLRRTAVKIGDKNLSVLIRVAKVKKFHFPVRVVEVLWAANYRLLSENIAIVARKLCLETKAVMIRIYVNSSVCDETCAWMILDPERAVSFIPPMQSELTCM